MSLKMQAGWQGQGLRKFGVEQKKIKVILHQLGSKHGLWSWTPHVCIPAPTVGIV